MNKIFARDLNNLGFGILLDAFHHTGRIVQRQDNVLVLLSSGPAAIGDRYTYKDIKDCNLRVRRLSKEKAYQTFLKYSILDGDMAKLKYCIKY